MKRLLSILLCLVLVLSVLSIDAFAGTTTDVQVNGTYTGTYTYNDGTKTLTLSNFNTDDGYINVVGTDITIALEGTNEITSIASAIYSNGSITFTGSGNLTINAGDYSSAIVIEGGSKNLNFNGTGTIKVATTNAEAIKVDGMVNFNSGEVSAETSANRAAVIAYGETKVDSLHNIIIDDDFGTYGITFGTDMQCTDSTGATTYVKTDVLGKVGDTYDKYVVSDNYYVGETITDKYGNTYTRRYDYYTDSYVIDKYDQYGTKDTYADNATGASWSYTTTLKVATLAVSGTSVKYDAQMITYKGAANSILVKAKDTSTDDGDDDPPVNPPVVVTDTIKPVSGKGVSRVDNYTYDNGTKDNVLLVTLSTKDGIDVTTFLSDYLSNNTASLKAFESNGTTQRTSGKIATGCVVKLYDSSSNVIDKVTVIVYGDVNSDGSVTLQDYGVIKYHTKPKGGTKITTMPNLVAADFNCDGTVNLQDYGGIKTFTKPTKK